MKDYGERTLSEALATSKEEKRDLMEILVSSGVSCRTCYQNPKGLGWSDGGFNCGLEKCFVNCPELSVCMKWRENGVPIKEAKKDD